MAAAHRSLLSCRDHIYGRLVAQMSKRGSDPAWEDKERQAVAIAANEWAGAHEGTRAVTVDDVERVEVLAVGHVDYAPMLALYVAELVLGVRTAP